jgi:hypothetical protein
MGDSGDSPTDLDATADQRGESLSLRSGRRRGGVTAQFAQMVDDQGNKLRGLPYEQLLLVANDPTQEITIGGRSGTISVIVERYEGKMVKVVVQGCLSAFSWLPSLKTVALHGFYKHRDGSIVEMRDEEFYGYD